MQKLSALDYLAGVESTEKTQASAPTNLHMITGEVASKSEDGLARILMDGTVHSQDDSQEISIEALGGLEEGDIVTILLSGEQGHGMTPLALGSVGSIDRIVTNVSEIQADYVKATELEADVAELGYAHITDGVIDNATINVADINELSATVADIADAQIANATIEQAQVRNLSVDYASANSLEAAEGRIGTLESTALTADSATIQNLEADTAKIHSLTANQLSAATGYIASLTAGNVTAQNIISDHGDFNTVKANAAKVANLTAQELEADHATIGSLDANYAQINMANVNNGWITNGTIKNAAIKSQMVESISANQLTAGTIDADEITVQNLKASSLTVQTADGYVYVGEKRIPTKEFIDSLKDELQAEIDGAIETFTVSAIPTLNNTPANEWVVSGDAEATRKLRAKHVGDIAYVINEGSSANGHCYRFAYDNTTQTFGWVLIQDSDVTSALSRISNLETFESNTTSWIEETDEGLTTIRQNHTTLSGKVDKTVVETKQLWYTKSNTTAPGKPTAEVTSTSTSGNAWRVVVPAYNASYPNYYYCLQYKLADGTFAWSAVVRDIAMGESQQQGRKGVSDAATAQTTANNAATAASTADGKAVAAQTTANSNIKSSVQLWFTKANTTAPNKPTAQVTTNSASTVNAWNLAIPTYNSSYPNYFSCYQQQKGDGTWQWTDVVFDRSITEAQAKAQAALPSSSFDTFTSTTFKNLVDEVDEQSSTITNLTTTVSNKADSSTVTTLSNTVNSVSQTTNSNSQYITNLTTTLGTNADGTSKSEDIVHKYNQLDQTLEGTISRVGSTEASLTTIGNPNIYPFFSIDFSDLAETRESDNGYWSIADHDGWQTISDCVTILSDGWAHWEYDNTSGTATVGVGALFARDIFGLKQSTTYTAVFEVRNVTAPAIGTSGWTLTAANASVAQVRYMSSGFYLDYNEDLADGSTIVRRQFTANNWGADKKWFAALYFGVSAGVALSVDVRISVYEGVYNGTFKPYVDPTLMTRMTSAESTITQNSNEISLRVTKTDYEKDVSVRLHIIRNTWTDQTWADHEVIGYTGNYSNENRITSTASATGFDGTTLKIGDLVIIEGVSTDSSTPHYMTCKVNAIPTSATAKINMTTVLATSSSGLRDRIVSAETDISQNSEAITLTAKKTESVGNLLYDTDLNSLTEVYGPGPRYWSHASGNNQTYISCSFVALTDPPEPGISYAAQFAVNDSTHTMYVYRALAFYNNDVRSPILSPGESYVATWWARVLDKVGTDKVTTQIDSANGLFPNVPFDDRPDLSEKWTLVTVPFTIEKTQTEIDALSYPYRLRFYGMFQAGTGGKVQLCGFKVAPQAYATSAELKVANDEISAKVDKDGVIAAINLSVEEEGGSLAKISADKVNIDGAAIFTSGRLSQTNLNAAYDSKGSAESAVNSIKVGGRNLLLGTNVPIEMSTNTTNAYSVSTELNSVDSTDELTLSFWAKSSVSRWIDLYWSTGSSYSNNDANFYPSFNLTTEWAMYSYTGIAGPGAATAVYLRLRQNASEHASGTTGATIDIRLMKLEKGNKATDWTPSPEDQTAYVDSSTDSKLQSYSTTTDMNQAISDSADSTLNSAKNYANDIQVAGENLLRRTARFVANTWARSNVSVPRAGVMRMNVTSSASPSATYKVNYLDWDDYGTGTYTLSFEARKAPVESTATVAMVNAYIAFHPISRYDNPVSSGYSRYKPATAINDIPGEWKRYTVTGTCPDDFTTGQESALASGSNLTIHFYIASGNRYPIEIRRVKLEKGDIATSYSEAPSDALLPYGGRNLLRGTGTEKNATVADGETSVYTGSYQRAAFLDSLELVSDETVFTYSFDYEVTGTVADNAYVYAQFRGTAPASGNAVVPAQDVEGAYNTVYVKNAMSGHYRCTFVLTAAQATATTDLNTNRARLVNASAGATLRVWNVKLEQGPVETPWTPAPEDVAADISAVSTVANNAASKANAIKRTQRIYYRSSSDSKPTAMPTAWVTETGNKWSANNTTASNWTTKVTPISSGTGSSVTKYLYLWTCEQYELASGTVGYTNVLLDDATTVIDGGKIITGSVSANSINASSGTFDTANIPALTADHIKANVISAVNNGTGTIDADKINVSAITIGQSQVTNLSTDLSDLSDGISDLNDDISAESNKRKAVYGTCSTAAGTAAKVVECANFELLTGSKVTIKFTTANTAAAPTLNVNATGAAPVWYNNAVAASGNPVLWGANATLSFVYDGSHWILDEKPPTYSGSSTTGATTRAKALSIAGALVVNGTTVLVRFSNSNTYTSNSVQFNLSSTGAASIWVDNASTSSSHHILWSANTVITFTRNSNGWFVVSRSDDSKTATSFLTEASSDGLMVHRSTDSTSGVKIADDIDIMRSGVSVANYGADTRIGPEDDSHILITSGSDYGLSNNSIATSRVSDEYDSEVDYSLSLLSRTPSEATWIRMSPDGGIDLRGHEVFIDDSYNVGNVAVNIGSAQYPGTLHMYGSFGMGASGSYIKGFYAGSTIVNLNNGSWLTVLSASDVAAKLGSGAGQANTICIAQNGDGGAYSGMVTGAMMLNGDARAYISPNYTGNIRINYILIRFA